MGKRVRFKANGNVFHWGRVADSLTDGMDRFGSICTEGRYAFDHTLFK